MEQTQRLLKTENRKNKRGADPYTSKAIRQKEKNLENGIISKKIKELKKSSND